MPTLTQAKITIKIGRAVTLDQTMIVATVASTLTLTFSVSNVLYSKFVLNTDPSVTITSFNLDQIQAGIVNFIQDGSNNTLLLLFKAMMELIPLSPYQPLLHFVLCLLLQ